MTEKPNLEQEQKKEQEQEQVNQEKIQNIINKEKLPPKDGFQASIKNNEEPLRWSQEDVDTVSRVAEPLVNIPFEIWDKLKTKKDSPSKVLTPPESKELSEDLSRIFLKAGIVWLKEYADEIRLLIHSAKTIIKRI